MGAENKTESEYKGCTNSRKLFLGTGGLGAVLYGYTEAGC
jgi:hypothetical protein